MVIFRCLSAKLYKSLARAILQPMYVIAVYDVGAERTQKMLKIGRRYLTWVQNSVLEGELSEVQLNEMVDAMLKVMDIEYDSLILFKSRDPRWMDKEVVGRERGSTDQFL